MALTRRLRHRGGATLVLVATVAAVAAVTTVAAFLVSSHHPGPRPTGPAAVGTGESLAATRVTAATTSTTLAQPLVAWTGPVEHLFFHPLVIRPELAFTNDRLAKGFRDYFVTVGEFRAILGQLYANRWTLVDIHRAVTGKVRVPPGRRPLVLSEDDVNYYRYSRPRGLGWRLVLDAAGNVKVEIRDSHGVRVTGEDIVPMVDDFVARHPDFSADGAKGVLAVTGFEGLLGEHVNDASSPDRAASVSRATAVATRLKATGWVFASHSYGHINFATSSLATATQDIRRWKAEAEPIIGTTDVFIYPFGAEPPVSSATVAMLRENGFTVLCDIDVVPRLLRGYGVVVMSRRHIDGLALEQQARRLAPFFDATKIEDRRARYGSTRR